MRAEGGADRAPLEALRAFAGQWFGADAVFDVEVTPSGRLGGYVIAAAFEGLSELERQALLEDGLCTLAPELTQKDVALLTFSPAEAHGTVSAIDDTAELYD